METRFLLATSFGAAMASVSVHPGPRTLSALVDSRWDTGSANLAGSDWTNGNDAAFGTAGAGIVKVGTGVTANANATIAGMIARSAGLATAGRAILTLAAASTLPVSALINGGLLEITAARSLSAVWQMARTTVNVGTTLLIANWSSYGINGLGYLDEVPMEEPKVLLLDCGTLEFSGTRAGSGQHAFSLGASGGTLDHTSGLGIAAKSEVEVTGKLYATGNIIDNGTLVLSGAAQFGASATITNNGTIINNSPTLKLPRIINHGKITCGGWAWKQSGLFLKQPS